MFETHTHKNSHTHTQKHTHAKTPSHTPTKTLSHTHTQKHSHPPHTYTHTQLLDPCSSWVPASLCARPSSWALGFWAPVLAGPRGPGGRFRGDRRGHSGASVLGVGHGVVLTSVCPLKGTFVPTQAGPGLLKESSHSSPSAGCQRLLRLQGAELQQVRQVEQG